MRHSISRLILGIIISITFIIAGILFFLNFKEASEEAYESASFNTANAAKMITLSFSGSKEDVLFQDESFYSMVNNTLEQVLEENELLFLYIVVPDAESSTITYQYIVGGEGTEDVVDPLRHQVQTRESISGEMLSVMNGTSVSENIEMNNEFGHVISCYMPLYDEKANIIAVVGADVSTTTIKKQLMEKLPSRLIATFVVGIASIIMLFFIMKKKVIRPIQEISNAMGEFGKNGNYDMPALSIDANNEFGLIETSFNQMSEKIRDNIANIKRYTEIQSQQAYELEMASKIQQGFLPDEQYRDEFSCIHASMIPAKLVGGDFYDYFEYNGHRILVIADVSGKGLSGAIFMASAISLVRGFVKQGLAPHEVLGAVNRELEHANPNMMFVTLFLAYIDIANGLIQYSNAGHNPPYVLCDGNVKALTASGSLPLGLFAEECYESTQELFLLGSTIYLYTDGVNEARNEKGEFFGIPRLEEILKKSQGEEVVDEVKAAVEQFTAGCEQSDDITMIALTSRTQSLTLPAERSAYGQLKEWILTDEEIPESIQKVLCLMAEEIFINIASYAYEEKGGQVRIQKQIQKDRCLLQFTDRGKAFDQSSNIVDIETYDPFERSGGLGRFLVQSMADEWRYVNFQEENVLLLIKKYDSKGG